MSGCNVRRHRVEFLLPCKERIPYEFRRCVVQGGDLIGVHVLTISSNCAVYHLFIHSNSREFVATYALTIACHPSTVDNRRTNNKEGPLMTDGIADIAGIIQGIGSLSAIGAAVWIYWRQFRDKKADDEAESRAFVQAIRTEVQEVWKEYKTLIRPSLIVVKQGEYYDGIVPISADILVTYNNSSARIGKIDNEGLRASIATVYIHLINYFNSFHLNNRKVEELEHTNITYNSAYKSVEMERRLKALRKFAEDLKASDIALETQVEALLNSIDVWLISHKAR
jgi:hypothetical protein